MSNTSNTVRPITKILIANRGEIASRVIHTAKRLGIPSVAVHSDPDRYALYVREADEAIALGGQTSAESYLDIERILDAIRESGADAVHPGFGFLSENANFARALDEAGIAFIGPGTYAIEAMGDKITSKKLAEEAGVNTVPGHPEAVADADEAYTIAELIGCPVMLKASAGGGGKGMRVANTLDEVRDGFIAAQNEARNAFGDDRVFVEKFIVEPRHIEIQIIADTHGNCVYLGERECSIQRRHQKVIEEAPSPFLDAATRRAMGEQAVALARAVDYHSAGTVEFIVDAERNFYFLEMNTRLQVEHPVTECITGLDIVELMIDVAAGKPLPITQDDVTIDGWAFEARVYAEDPDRGFLPSTGRISHYAPPSTVPAENGAFTRVDTGVSAGGEISMFYDPMIAKLITWAPTRDEAIAHMQDALDSYLIRGVSSNIPFLSALFAHPALHAGKLTTNFIEEHFPEGFDSHEFDGGALAIFPIVAAWLEQQIAQRDRMPNSTPMVPSSSAMAVLPSARTRNDHIARTGSESEHSADDTAHDHTHDHEEPAISVFDGETRIDVAEELLHDIDSDWAPGDAIWHGRLDEAETRIGVERIRNGWRLSQGGAVREYRVMEPHVADLMPLMPVREAADLSKFLLSPMPGLLVKVLVAAGDTVSAGQDLAVIEAMKMENTLAASIDGVVARIAAEPGTSLAVDDVIIEFETD
ncbi:MAG: acetyl/propionyl-CoA carboxylase subunit alpha [Gammaproteobacteria bacterium]|nr:MAG: acetyl/propionyl-CoA carboxylase subunit alpha [Gammaproteobacteria bacterium]